MYADVDANLAIFWTFLRIYPQPEGGKFACWRTSYATYGPAWNTARGTTCIVHRLGPCCRTVDPRPEPLT